MKAIQKIFFMALLIFHSAIKSEDLSNLKSNFKNSIYAGLSVVDPVRAATISYERYISERITVGLSINYTLKDFESSNNPAYEACSKLIQFYSCETYDHPKKLGGLAFLKFFPTTGSFFISIAGGKQPNLNVDTHLGQDLNVNNQLSASSTTSVNFQRTNTAFGVLSLGWRWMLNERFFLQIEGGALKELSGNRSAVVQIDGRAFSPGIQIASINTLLYEQYQISSTKNHPGKIFFNLSFGTKF
ncbi:hypothetical protein LEP1GSC047_0004 [Leptospira inadai serovar Lyme str. 10]|uniref:Outer membrane protein beta-barrel domain protein n=1 Tax=Leptospira inadai serovar Lyme str. 10 TaxID=1049790 RepID=V6HF85_9LEPT|nr:hypothetical protein [Leptospira inadai]EQA38942.1 hypothetical protein LEP1GSC047_0004 [Leptospira inadai serovar Lyme str. 10]